MTPSDAQRIERLIQQLRKDARLFPSMESIRAAADELARLRVDAARYQWLRRNAHHVALYSDASLPFIQSTSALDASIDAALAATAQAPVAPAPMRAEKEDGRG